MELARVHQSSEEITARNSDVALEVISRNSKKLSEAAQALKELGSLDDSSVEMDGFLGMIKSVRENHTSIGELRDHIDSPRKVVENLESIKTTALSTNQLLKGVAKSQKNLPPKIKVEIVGAEIITLKGDKGDKGERGLVGSRGPRGEKGDTGKNGERGLKGETGPRGERGQDGKNGISGKDGKDGKHGLDGSPDTPEQIVKKLKTLKEKNKLPASAIYGLKKFIEEVVSDSGSMNQIGYAGGGDIIAAGSNITITTDENGRKQISALGGGNIETPAGTVNGVNTTYTVTNEPIYIVVDRVLKFENIDYTYSAGTIEITDGAPPVQLIRSFY